METKKKLTLTKGYKPIGYLYYNGKRIGRCGITIDNIKESKDGVILNYRFTYKTFAYYVDLPIDWFMTLVGHDSDMYVGLLQSWRYFDIAPWFCRKMNTKYEEQRSGIELIFERRGGTDE